MKREIIRLTDDEIDEVDDFNFSGILNSSEWVIRDETYKLVDIFSRDVFSSTKDSVYLKKELEDDEKETEEEPIDRIWETVVRRDSDGKYFKFIVKSDGEYELCLEQVSPENGKDIPREWY